MTEILITGLTAGVQNRAAHEQMKPEALYYATDITTDVFGSVVCRNHHEVNSYFNTQVFTDPVKDIYQVDVEGTNKRLLYYRVANVLYCFNSYTGATRTVNSAMTGSHVSYAAFKPAASTYTYIYITDGITMLADNGSASITWGISAPEGVPFIRYTTGGNLTAGSYRYRYSFYDATTGSESNASIACAALTATANQATEISNIQASINSRVTSRRIYRTLVNGGSYYLVATIPDNVLTEFTDTQADSALATLLTEDQGVPPTGKIVRTYKNYLMLAGLSNYPNRVHFCIANLPDNFPETYYIEAGSSDDVVLNMIEWGGRMYFIQTASISGLDGTNADTFDVAGTRSDTGTAASQSPAAASDGIYFLGFDGVYRFDGAKSVKISEAIERAFGRTPSGLYEIVEYPQVESSTRAVVYQG
ncbi:MAG: hypothetical protein KKD77_24025, partial [Gammaproteobacteria bacterium]|nr:hypothetical protein [Gammaproteobacteria bacterium]